MSSGIGTTLANQILNQTLGAVAYTPPATVYVALFLVAPTKDGGGTEVSGAGYARVPIANNTTEWPAASTLGKQNANYFTFTAAAADWGTVVGAALFASPSDMIPMYYGTLDTARTVFNGDTPTFPPNTFRVQFA